MLTIRRPAVLFCLAVLVTAVSPMASAQEAIIIDHNCTDLAYVPAYWIEQAKANLLASYGHTSHGSQPITGMNLFSDPPGSLYWWDHDGTMGGLSLWDRYPSGDLGNPDRYTWEARTRTMLEDDNNDRNLVIWSWCGQADTTEANMQIYLDLMSGLIDYYDEVTFVYMTGHLNGTGEDGNLNQRNNQIRSHVLATGGILFDFADIESYDPDGEYFLDRGADDGCYYDGGNWAIEWCDEHQGSDLCASCSCAHSQPLNCNLKGRAFWWMLARIAGWQGPYPGDMNCDGVINGFDIDGFVEALAATPPDYPEFYAAYPTCNVMDADCNGDGNIDGLDIDPFLALVGG